VRSDGTVVAWGCGGPFGQCLPPSGLSGVTSISAGESHNVALKADGTIVAWGCGIDLGQCNVPSNLSGVTAVSADAGHSLALLGNPLPTSIDQCKEDGWNTFGVFKNEGDCVAYVASKGGNAP
jgi:hypothetical protein